MLRLFVATLALSVIVGCGPTPLKGRLVDAMHGDAPIAGQTLVARATGPASLTCQQLSGKTDAQGNFTIPNLCLSSTSYDLQPANPTLFLAEAQPVKDTSQELTLKAWWAPAGEGLYILHGQDLTRLKTHADLKDVEVPPTNKKVYYPAVIPDKRPQVVAGDDLVLTGKETIAKTKIDPLLHTDARTFGDVKLDPWWYIGVAFKSDTDFTPVTATPAKKKVTDISKGDRVARFIDGAALPAGLYAVYRAGGRRVSIVQFGEATADKTASQ